MPYPETIDAVGITDFTKWSQPERFSYKPQAFRDEDVDIEIDACGICGSDVWAASGHWGEPYKPVALGHEIIGRIVKVGPKTKAGLKLGDRVGVGAQCDCDDTCIPCKAGFDCNCKNSVFTYFGTYPETKINTHGGNASHIRLNSKFVFKIPDSIETIHAAPLLCGGITGFSPLLQNKVGKGSKVGVAGIGGIGHMTILFAKALGAEVTAISRSHSKEEDAKKLGADHFVAIADEDNSKYEFSLDLIVNTSSSFTGTSFESMFALLKPRGKVVYITAPPVGEKITLTPQSLVSRNVAIGGSLLGTTEEIQYMLDFAAEHNIKPWVQTVELSEVNLGQAWQKVLDGDVKYRFTVVGYDKFFGRK